MMHKNIIRLFILLAATSFSCCGIISPDTTDAISQKLVRQFVNEDNIESGLENIITDMGLRVNDVVYKDDTVKVVLEQPQNLSDEQIELAYLSVFSGCQPSGALQPAGISGNRNRW